MIPSLKLRPSLQISILSFIVLSLELAFIRLIPAEVKAISYFTNLLLFSSFFGLGIGCILSNRIRLDWLLPTGALALFALLTACRGIVIYDTGEAVHYWLQGSETDAAPILNLPLELAALLFFFVAALPFVSLGATLAQRMDLLPRLKAYSADIVGSLSGTVVFSILSWFGFPPWILICLLLILWATIFLNEWKHWVFTVATGLLFLVFSQSNMPWKWSPYYYVQYKQTSNNITVYVNSSFHQEALNFESQDPNYKPIANVMIRKFSAPYDMYRKYHDGRSPEKVLLLGTGSGNDVHVAIANGAKDITAVEIDPVILGIGKSLNPLQPYQNEKVKIVQDDGRHFLWNTREKFDLVIFGTLDSQTLLSGYANLRLENYIYTSECFADVRKVLNEGGMVSANYSVFKPWFTGRVYKTVQGAFEGELQLLESNDNYLFNTIVLGAKGIPNFKSDARIDERFEHEIASTDDWPYIYMQYPTLSKLYLKVGIAILCLIFLSFFLVKRTQGGSSYKLDFFFLGLGFTLFQSASIVKLALLFGTTWIVSAVVFASTLFMIYLSNLFVEYKRGLPLNLAWFGLVTMIIVNAFLPARLLLEFEFPARVLASAVLIGIPVFFAGNCFSTLFKSEKSTGLPLGINLVGAMAGGLLEYLSMVTGMQAIWWLLAVVYLLGYLFHLRAVKSAAPPAVMN